MQKQLLSLSLVVLVAAPLGCAQTRGFFEETPPGERRTKEMREQEERDREREEYRRRTADFLPEERCPAQLENIAVLAVDYRDGVALQFTTANDEDVKELQSRVEGLLDFKQKTTKRGAEGSAGLEPIPADDVRYEELNNGARLIFTTGDERDMRALRSQVASRANWLRTSDQCPREILSLRAPGGGRAG